MARQVTFEFESIPAEGLKRGEVSGVPAFSGVFRIYDPGGDLLLLDKTHNLKLRLGRFYREAPLPGTLDLRGISDRIEFCRTDSPFESQYLLYLERRRWFPATYRRMRTFPLYYLLAIDPGRRFPRIDAGRRIRSGVRYFGPFPSRRDAGQVRGTMERIFRIRPCEYDIQGDDPYPDCLYFQIHTCSRPCNGDIDRNGYLEDVEASIALALGDGEGAVAPLLARIRSLAEATRFEAAEQVRLQLERARKAASEDRPRIFEVGRFDHAILLKARSSRERKIALLRAGRIRSLELHRAASIRESLEASLGNPAAVPGFDAADLTSVYDEFCLAASFLRRPLRSVRFFPIGPDPAETAAAVAFQVHSGSSSGVGPSPPADSSPGSPAGSDPASS